MAKKKKSSADIQRSRPLVEYSSIAQQPNSTDGWEAERSRKEAEKQAQDNEATMFRNSMSPIKRASVQKKPTLRLGEFYDNQKENSRDAFAYEDIQEEVVPPANKFGTTDKSVIRDMIMQNPDQYPIVSQYIKNLGVTELDNETDKTWNRKFAVDGDVRQAQDFKKKIADCGHSPGQPYCNFTLGAMAKDANVNSVRDLIDGSTRHTLARAKRNPDDWDIQDAPFEDGEQMVLKIKKAGGGHTQTGVYDKATGKMSIFEANTVDLDTNREGVVHNVYEPQSLGDEYSEIKYVRPKKEKKWRSLNPHQDDSRGLTAQLLQN